MRTFGARAAGGEIALLGPMPTLAEPQPGFPKWKSAFRSFKPRDRRASWLKKEECSSKSSQHLRCYSRLKSNQGV